MNIKIRYTFRLNQVRFCKDLENMCYMNITSKNKKSIVNLSRGEILDGFFFINKVGEESRVRIVRSTAGAPAVRPMDGQWESSGTLSVHNIISLCRFTKGAQCCFHRG